ncbi:putative undecaprenyl-phosphate N-acetylglucosaminyl 1-phosphate transferase [bacterium HR17]|uniref:Putative undecaprenyl-phosphate N-acetylglucosaminyl 1-phosphate transferase n=1 Tax=Candidatus Fervidibacter japonicus TaxID=2035412 RepID=A0A2H5XA48_9BACT|nr:putative undecaprenyl-phosphate N-acetylglucosaminyl 1-phosphate transferase [bacterium HR17]
MVGYVGLIALVATIVAVAQLRRWAVGMGWIYRPRSDRWEPKFNPHPRTIALGGGLGIAAGTLSALLLWALLNGSALWLRAMPFALGALLLGLVDDLRDCSARLKLLAQFILGVATALGVVRLAGFSDGISVPLTAFCAVALMNAVNMMDNMDGVASGLVTLAALGFALLGFLTANPLVTGAGLILAAGSFGFWLFNKPPATVFMGDTGSLLLGYLLAVLGVTATHGEYPHIAARLFAPALMVGSFWADMAFVVLWRLTHGLPLMKGDRNHLSHRLAVRFGRSEWRANFALYSLQTAFCLCGLVVALAPPLAVAITLFIALLIALVLFAALWRVVP